MNKKILRRSRRICLRTSMMISLQTISLLHPFLPWALPLSDGEQELGGR